jgi:hypothetical protein
VAFWAGLAKGAGGGCRESGAAGGRGRGGLARVWWRSVRAGPVCHRARGAGAAAVNRIGVLGVISLGAIARLRPASHRRVRVREGVRDMMRRRQVLVFVAAAVCGAGPLAVPAAAGAWAVPAARAAAVPAAVSWGKAIEVPGLAVLNKGGFAGVVSVSCASAGNCAAGGGYSDRHGNGQGFVAAERNGVWGRAVEVPGLAAGNTSIAGARVDSVSCGSAGNCAAGGYYPDRHGNTQGFVVSERNGRWGTGIEVPGLAALNKRGFA